MTGAVGAAGAVFSDTGKQPFKMHSHLVTRSSRHTVNSSQRRYTRWSTRHTILGDFGV